MLLLARSSIFMLLMALAGCGFHLRGSVILPELMSNTYIQDNSSSGLIAAKLRRALKKNNVNILNDIVSVATDKPVAILTLSDERFDRRLLSSGTTTLIKEYQLNYTITFSMRDKNDNLLLSRQTINITREQTFDETQVLSKTSEQQKLNKEMIDDAARQMLRQLQTIKAL